MHPLASQPLVTKLAALLINIVIIQTVMVVNANIVQAPVMLSNTAALAAYISSLIRQLCTWRQGEDSNQGQTYVKI